MIAIHNHYGHADSLIEIAMQTVDDREATSIAVAACKTLEELRAVIEKLKETANFKKAAIQKCNKLA